VLLLLDVELLVDWVGADEDGSLEGAGVGSGADPALELGISFSVDILRIVVLNLT